METTVLDPRAVQAVADWTARDAGASEAGSPRLRVVRLGVSEAWLVRGGRRALVLKRTRRNQDEDDACWEHAFLDRLAVTGFPAPRPVPALAGRSCLRLDDRVWTATTYLPGRALYWEPAPPLEEAGAFLAAYHCAARGVFVDRQRPTGVPLTDLGDLTPWDRLPVALGHPDRARRFARLADELSQELRSLDTGGLERIVVHGDCTADNTLIDGTPPRIVGLIDFGNAYREAWPADLGAGLWRSGRAEPEAVALDARRVARFVAGYHHAAPLELRLVRAVPALIVARGLQLIVRWTRRATTDELPRRTPLLALTLDRALWVRERRTELEEAIVSALSGSRA